MSSRLALFYTYPYKYTPMSQEYRILESDSEGFLS